MNPRLFFDRLINIRKMYVDEMNGLLAQFQLTISTWQTLKTIYLNAPINSVAVSKALNIEKPTATKTIQRLIEMELIETAPGADRREKLLLLTPLGIERFNEISALIESHQLDALHDVTSYDILVKELEHIEHYYQHRKDNRIEK